MADRSEFRPNLDIFGVSRRDPGWIYVVRNRDLYKIGKTKNPKKRLHREAKTWIPDLEVLAVKPFWNISHVEEVLHTGFCQNWYDREWFKFNREEEAEFLISSMQDFYEDDRDMNSVDFIYFVNGSGLCEFTLERSRRGTSLRRWLKAETGNGR